MDRVLHAERIGAGGAKRLHDAQLQDLPDGSMVGEGDQAWLVLGGELVAWSPFGYGGRRRLPGRGTVRTLTPPSMIEVIRAGYEPALHPTALGG